VLERGQLGRYRHKDLNLLQMLRTSIGEISALQSEGALPLIVFLHGTQGDKELFRPLLREPFIKHHATLALDLPGFGDSTKSQSFDYSISSFAQCLEELLSSYPGDMVLVGHSLGGMIATRLLDSTLNIRGLISLEGNLQHSDCGKTMEIVGISEREFLGNYLPRLKNELSRSSEPSAAARLSALRKADPNALYKTARAIVAESQSGVLFDILSRSSCPVLLLIGADGRFVTKSVPGKTQTVIIPHASHFLLQDNYPAVATAIERFLSAL
jgi:pimeloyl-ACP methyl ester carboxylesterase